MGLQNKVFVSCFYKQNTQMSTVTSEGLCCAKCLLSFREGKTCLHQVTVTCFNALVPSQVDSLRKIHPAINS